MVEADLGPWLEKLLNAHASITSLPLSRMLSCWSLSSRLHPINHALGGDNATLCNETESKPRFANTRNCRNWGGGGGGGGNTQRQLCFTGIIMIWKERRWREPWRLFALLFFRELKIAFFLLLFFFFSLEGKGFDWGKFWWFDVKIDFVENYTAALRNKSICQRNYLLMIK